MHAPSNYFAPWNFSGACYHAPWTRRTIDPINEADKIQPEDIAQSLAMENRFNGCTFLPYSVASHCVNCVDFARTLTRDPGILLNVLLHDVEEAVYRDLPTWLKRDPAIEAAYVAPSVAFRRKLFDAWGVEWLQDHEYVKRADNVVGAREYAELVVNRRADTIKVRGWREAESDWISLYFSLLSARGKV